MSDLLGNGLVIPLVAGMAIGIAFIALFAGIAIYHGSSDTVTSTTRSGISITLEGLKDQYSIDEPLNFTVTAKGRGALCDDPTATIMKAKSAEVAYDFPNIDVIYECLPDPVDHDIIWTLKDMMDPYSPILIGQSGRYTLEVELAGVVLQKDFVIYDDEITDIPANQEYHNLPSPRRLGWPCSTR